MKSINRCLQIFRLKALYGQLKKTASNLWLRLQLPFFFANYSLSLLRLPLGNTPCSAASIHRTQRNLPLTQSQRKWLKNGKDQLSDKALFKYSIKVDLFFHFRISRERWLMTNESEILKSTFVFLFSFRRISWKKILMELMGLRHFLRIFSILLDRPPFPHPGKPRGDQLVLGNLRRRFSWRDWPPLGLRGFPYLDGDANNFVTISLMLTLKNVQID